MRDWRSVFRGRLVLMGLGLLAGGWGERPATWQVAERPVPDARVVVPARVIPNGRPESKARQAKAQALALARKYAPIRYLHPDEKLKPGEPLEFIRSSRVQEHRNLRPDRTLDGFSEGRIDPAKLRGLRKDNLYLDLKDTDAARRGNTARSPTLYQYDEKSRTMTYWFFYPYNDSPGPGNINHEGDWERITIQFDAKQRPTAVRYSAHNGHVTRSWANAPKEGGRPVVYVAKGSHASSPEPRAHALVEIGGRPAVRDVFGRGERVDGARQPFRDVTAEPWYGTRVHWGERGKLAAVGQGFSSGPSGPSPSKGPVL